MTERMDDARELAEQLIIGELRDGPDPHSQNHQVIELSTVRLQVVVDMVATYIRDERSDIRHAAGWACDPLIGRSESADPDPETYAAARDALRRDHVGNPADAMVDALARATHSELHLLARHLIEHTGPAPVTVASRAGELLTAACTITGDVLRWDGAFVDYLRLMGHAAAGIADAAADGARQRLASYQQRQAAMTDPETLRADLLWAYWREPRGSQGTPRFLVTLAMAVWQVRLGAGVDLSKLPKAQVGTIQAGGDTYGRIERAVGAASWAIGADGVTIDDDTYAEQPSMLNRHVPRSWGLRQLTQQPGKRRPHQLTLPLADGATVPLMVALTHPTDAGAVVPPLAGKVLLVLMAGARHGTMVTTSLGELAKLVYPDAQRVQRRELARVVDGLRALADLRLVLPDDTEIPLFVIRTPRAADRAFDEQGIAWELPALFGATVRQHAPALCGWFLINLSGAMRLDSRRPQLLRQYIRAASAWNDAHDPGTNQINPARVVPYTLESWAALNNTLSLRSVDYLASDRTAQDKRRPLSDDLRETSKSLDELADAGLIRIETLSRGRELRILPPDPYLAAHDELNQRHKPVNRPAHRGRSQQRR